jgi:N-acetylglucosaminyldiphosphoundecaprenol N-acetyl-beta-D-mannosaminyltransferase
VWNPGDMDLPTRPFTGIPVVAAGNRDVINHLAELAQAPPPGGCDVHLLESNGLATAEVNQQFEDLLRRSCMVLPDGRWLELLTKKSAAPLTQFRGEDLFRELCEAGLGFSLRHFFVGSTNEKLERLFAQLRSSYPGIDIAGQWAPPFRELTEDEQRDLNSMIGDARAQVIWIGISTPRQDFEAARLAKSLGVVVIAVGAAFEFVSGDKSVAPRWMTSWGIEWLFRLASEPRRLAKRYLIGNLLFLWRFVRFWGADRASLRQISRR